MTSDDCTVSEGFELQEAEFDAGWCEGIGILGGLEIDEVASVGECERIYRLNG